MIKTQEELAQKIASCKSCLDKKFAGAEGKRAIILCGGTGCLSSNSAQIAAKFKELLKERGLDEGFSFWYMLNYHPDELLKSFGFVLIAPSEEQIESYPSNDAQTM